MKKIAIIILVMLSVQLFAQVEQESFAVIELFTSEGCSSCPPADNLLVDLKEHVSLKDLNTLVIARHITYWDYLGWTDPYGMKKNNDDQYAYCAKIGSQVYTPQFVVNGEYISLNGNNILNYAANALSKAPEKGIRLSLASSATSDNIEVNYSLNNIENGKKLKVFLLENDLSQQVTAGENYGKTLHHDYVCRYMVERVINGDGKVIIPVPKDVNRDHVTIAAYVQDPSSLQLIAATKGFKLKTASFEQEKDHTTLIYPNPANHYIYIENESQGHPDFIIYNIYGQVAFKGTLTNNRIDISGLSNGQYLLVLTDHAGYIRKKHRLSVIGQ